ncbi:MAG: helix-turn-helix domain-containing protein [Clostridiales bacterium]|nr:helix-turn-helix domain-containing protein [Clostridiales bacterium]
MIRAYDETYVEKARVALGRMLDFAVYDLNYDITLFFDWFLDSGIAEDFGRGDCSLLVGKSGVELACEVLERIGKNLEPVSARYAAGRSEEYWTGWALAYYQWRTALPFREIVRHIPIMDIQALYSPYHEMDIRQFSDQMDVLYRHAQPETNLKRLRQKTGLTQKELSAQSGVPLRTIQQYEQRQKNINKAQAEYLFQLASALVCQADDLLEKVPCAE